MSGGGAFTKEGGSDSLELRIGIPVDHGLDYSLFHVLLDTCGMGFFLAIYIFISLFESSS